MSELRIDEVHARVAQFADTINNYSYPRVPAVKNGYRLLASGLYADAVHVFSENLRDTPDDQDAQFGVALARLCGTRPHRHNTETIRRVLGHLKAAPDLPQAYVLQLLVEEDRDLSWRLARSKKVPRLVVTLANQVPREMARLILLHVPAPEARVWRALAAVDRQRGASAS